MFAFKPEQDERLWRIEREAGLTAFLTYFFVTLGLLITRGITDAGVLSNPDFLLVVPWLFTGLVFFAVEWKKGYFSAVREENTRTRERRFNTRGSLLLSVVLFAVFYFTIQRLQLFSDHAESLTKDITDASVVACIWGFTMWFLVGRKSRSEQQ